MIFWIVLVGLCVFAYVKADRTIDERTYVVTGVKSGTETISYAKSSREDISGCWFIKKEYKSGKVEYDRTQNHFIAEYYSIGMTYVEPDRGICDVVAWIVMSLLVGALIFCIYLIFVL